MAKRIVQKSKSSAEYWRQREEENLQKYLLEEEDYERRLQEILDYMQDQIQREINGFYAKYAEKEGITMAEAKLRIDQADIEAFARKAKKYVEEKNFSKQANDEMRLYNATMKINRLELLKANIGLELTAGFNDLEKYTGEILTERAMEELRRQAGILGDTIQNNEKTAKNLVNASFRNATYSERIWMYQDMLKAELDTLLRQGLIQGKNPKELATHLQKLFGVSKNNAERLMRTELARVQIEAQKQSYERNNFEQYTFLALGSACEACLALDGKHFKVKEMLPGDNAPPIHPNCRCATSAYMDENSYNEWLDTYQEHGLSFEEWKKEKTKISDDKGERDFFGTPRDITSEWTGSSKEGKVSETQEYIVNGEVYKVDGKRVLLDYDAHEKAVAKVIAKESGRNVQLVPRITFPQGIQTPDYLIDNEKWDLKTISTPGKNVLYNAVKKKKNQANNFIFDVTNCPLELEEINQQIYDLFRSTHLTFIDQIGVYEDGKIVRIYKRKK